MTDNISIAITPADVAATVALALNAAGDRPHPLDADRSPRKYAALAQDFRSSAWRHLDEDDLPQAANKAWALVAETVKAISAQHGGIIHSHRAIIMVTEGLARLAGNAGGTEIRSRIINGLTVARLLHANFYEDGASLDAVLEGLMLCEQLSELLYARFWPAGATAGAADPDLSAPAGVV